MFKLSMAFITFLGSIFSHASQCNSLEDRRSGGLLNVNRSLQDIGQILGQSRPSNGVNDTEIKVIRTIRGRIILIHQGSKTFVYMVGLLPCLSEVTAGCLGNDQVLSDLRRQISQHPNNRLTFVLNLDGGDLNAAYAISDLIKNEISSGRAVETHLPSGAICSSACLPIFTASRNRTTGTDHVRFGFHDCTDEYGPSDLLTQHYKNVLANDGVQRTWLDSVLDGTPQIVHAENAIQSGLVSRRDDSIVPFSVLRTMRANQGRTPSWGDLRIPLRN